MRILKRILLVFMACFLASASHAQKSITIPIDYDAAIGYNGSSNANNNYATAIQNAAYSVPGSTSGQNVNRALMHFDLSKLPAGVQIISAKLNLHATGALGNLSGHIGNNSALLQRITKSWDVNTVTWNTQPDSTHKNEVILPASSYSDQDYLNIDILNLVKDMQQDGNYGLILKLVKEVSGNALLFYSSDYGDINKRPSVTFQYRLPDMAVGNYDAAVGYNGDSNADNNYGNAQQNGAYAIPGSISGYNVNRALIHFDLSKIPSDAVITGAKLNLYATGPIGNTAGHIGNANSAVLQRATETWTEYGATWNNQPQSTPTNQVILPASTSAVQDYVNIDVKLLVEDMLKYGNDGFLLKMYSQVSPNGLLFCSFDHPDVSKRPSLDVQYYIKKTIEADHDAAIGYNGDKNADVNYGNAIQNAAYVVPGSTSGVNVNRALMHFDLSSIPQGSFVLSARLNLYATGPLGGLQGHTGTNNTSVLQRATKSWTENIVTWNTQPTTTNVNEVTLPQSTSPTQDYLGIDVRNLVLDMIKNTNDGFLLKLKNEQTSSSPTLKSLTDQSSNGLLFCSANYNDASKHPKLEIKLGTPSLNVDLVSLPLSADASNNKTISVQSNTGWTISCDQDWLSFDSGVGVENESISIHAKSNPTVSARTATITISVPGFSEKKINVTQEAGKPVLTVPSTLALGASAALAKKILVETNTTWTISSDQSWATASKTSGTGSDSVSISATPNTLSTIRTAVITIHSSEFGDKSITITQDGMTGIDDINEKDIVFYPNPVQNILFLNEKLASCKIVIVDSKGAAVLSKDTDDGKIDLSTLSSGLYIIKIENKHKIVTKQIIKN